ncbi:MotA/TolQ/ExbB proton channel family protein [Burkholderia contaminans]|uniref:MotA/TolQ/ExbB proton channel family protein n=10 Tax=Burkholderiaceae TaxID=119060 RepID=UPI0031128C45
MYTANREMRGRAIRRAQWLTADRIIPYSCIMLMFFAALLAAWGVVTNGFTSNAIALPGVDFSVFWTASHLVLQGHAASVYDASSFLQAEFAHFGAFLQHRPLPWLYPPTMLLLIAPVALVPFLPAYFLFFAGSLLCYALAVSRLSGLRAHLPVPRAAALVVVAYSAVCMAALFGQNSILTAGIAALAGADRERVFVPLAEAARDAADDHDPAALAARVERSERVLRALRHAMLRSQRRLEFGQVLLASIGSTAPFVGLLGTVWGIYHALGSIAASGQAQIENVAGPVGEALIMTAFGLVVAIPAVLAYNILGRLVRQLAEELDGFARDLHVFVCAQEA